MWCFSNLKIEFRPSKKTHMAIVIYRHPDVPQVVRVMLLDDKKKIKSTINALFTGYYNYVDRAYYIYIPKGSRVSLGGVYRRICESLGLLGTSRLEFYKLGNIIEWLHGVKQQYDVSITTELLDVAEPDETRKFINKLREYKITCESEYTAHCMYGISLSKQYKALYPDFLWSAVTQRPFDQ